MMVLVNPEFPINIVTLYICKIFAIQLKTVDAVLQAEQDIEYLRPNVREFITTYLYYWVSQPWIWYLAWAKYRQVVTILIYQSLPGHCVDDHYVVVNYTRSSVSLSTACDHMLICAGPAHSQLTLSASLLVKTGEIWDFWTILIEWCQWINLNLKKPYQRHFCARLFSKVR